MRPATTFAVSLCALGLAGAAVLAQAQATTSGVRPIAPPAVGLPPEAESAAVRKFAFIAYGDTRGSQDGVSIQTEHARVVDRMLAILPEQQAAGFPVKFVLQSGDAVASGRNTPQWNVSFTPLIERLTREAGLPYFFAVGNHDVGSQPMGGSERQLGYQNVAAAMAGLWPPEDSPRRLNGYPTFSFGFGQYFFIAIDSDIVTDETQRAWVVKQLEGLDRQRFPHLVVFFHHPPITSGSHGGPTVVEAASEAMRKTYMPLFRQHHVRMIVAGHDHLFDHYVERYEDASGHHRLDHVVTGGGGAPIYVYRGEPNFQRYVDTAKPERVTIEHIARPGPNESDNPHHAVVFDVDGDRLWIRVLGSGNSRFEPHGVPRLELVDRVDATSSAGGRAPAGR
jgi:hypothetical protein